MIKIRLNKTILVFLLLLIGTAKNIYSQNKYGITVFGTDQITSSQLKQKYNKELNELVELYNDREQYDLKNLELKQDFIKLGNFSYSNLYLFKSYIGDFDFIIDFVEEKDKSTRLNYRRIDSQKLHDPEGLLSKWIEYENLSSELYQNDEITDMSCPVIHCMWSFNHEKLEPYLTFFNEIAPLHKDYLVKVLNTSESAIFREKAAFLLAHAAIDPVEFLKILLPSIHDSNSLVRNSSMRVIYYIARAFPDSDIDLSKIIKALDYPSFTDRNKALVILRSLPLTNLTKENMNRLVPILLEILEKKDAHNFRNAHVVLKKISNQDYSFSDIDNWKNWGSTILNKEKKPLTKN